MYVTVFKGTTLLLLMSGRQVNIEELIDGILFKQHESNRIKAEISPSASPITVAMSCDFRVMSAD